MYQFVLWFNMICFTLMFASVGLSYLVYDRNRAAWLRDYLIYAAAYTLWLLFATWVYFRAVYLTESLPLLTLIFARVRLAVSIVIAIFGPLFFFRSGGFAIRGKVRAIVIGVAVAITIVIVVLLIIPSRTLSYIVTPAFNLYLGVLSWLSFSVIRKSIRAPQRPMLPLLFYSGAAYVVLALFGISLPLLAASEQTLIVQAIAAGTFLFGWAILMIYIDMKWISRASTSGSTIPDSYLTDYSITSREAEVLALLLTGLTSSEIAGKLFISQRTVETHIYNMYDKCGVRNRAELLAKISAYGLAGE